VITKLINQLISKYLRRQGKYSAYLLKRIMLQKHRDRPRENVVRCKHETKNVQSFKPRSTNAMT